MKEMSTLCCIFIELFEINHTVPMWKELYLQIICFSLSSKYIPINRMKIETENNQLFIHYKIPDHDNWNPKPAVLAWLGINLVIYLKSH